MTERVFAKKLKFYRKKMGLTQKSLGERAGVGQVTVANYENGSRFPGEETLLRVAESLGITIDMLFYYEKQEAVTADRETWSVTELIDYLLHHPFDHGLSYITGWKKAMQFDLTETFSRIFIPVLRETGDRWMSGDMMVSEEHLVSERIRELISLVSVRERLPSASGQKSRVWIGFCAPSDRHDMPLFMMSQILRAYGWQTLFLGADVPVNDLLSLCRKYKPDLITVSIVMPLHRSGLDAYLQRIEKSPHVSCPLMICGEGAGEINASAGTGTKIILRPFEECMEYALNLNY